MLPVNIPFIRTGRQSITPHTLSHIVMVLVIPAALLILITSHKHHLTLTAFTAPFQIRAEPHYRAPSGLRCYFHRCPPPLRYLLPPFFCQRAASCPNSITAKLPSRELSLLRCLYHWPRRTAPVGLVSLASFSRLSLSMVKLRVQALMG